MNESRTELPNGDAYEERRQRRNLHLKIDGYFDSPQSLRRLLGYADQMLALQESGTISSTVANLAVTYDRDVEFRLAFSEPRDNTQQPKDEICGDCGEPEWYWWHHEGNSENVKRHNFVGRVKQANGRTEKFGALLKMLRDEGESFHHDETATNDDPCEHCVLTSIAKELETVWLDA